MEYSKMLVEQLQDALNKNNRVVCNLREEFRLNRCGGYKLCNDCDNEVFNVIIDRIEQEYIPRPRFEDGEPVRFGDEFSNHNDEHDSIRCIAMYDDGHYLLVGKDGIKEWVPPGDRVKRYEPEAVDADGEPIKVGDTVWMTYDPDFSQRIKEVLPHGYMYSQKPCVIYESGGWDIASDVAHERPDSMERIEEDSKKIMREYWKCEVICANCPAKIGEKTPKEHYNTDSCGCAVRLDLLHRQRELLKKGL